MSQNFFLQTEMTLAFLKLLLSVRPQLKKGLKMSRVHIPADQWTLSILGGTQE